MFGSLITSELYQYSKINIKLNFQKEKSSTSYDFNAI